MRRLLTEKLAIPSSSPLPPEGEGLGVRGGLTVAEIRDLLGTTRKYAVPLCEYLDRTGVTRREGDLRFLSVIPTRTA